MTRLLAIFFFALIATGLVLWGSGYFESGVREWTSSEKLDFFVAVETGDLSFVKGQLIAGLSPNSKNSAGVTPLCLAAKTGHLGVVRVLLEAGADEYGRSTGLGDSLRCAANGGRAEVVSFLTKFRRKNIPKLKCRYPYCRRPVP